MNNQKSLSRVAALVLALIFAFTAAAQTQPIRKVLIIGDSMTGWLAERVNAWGKTDGFSVATVVWDGSTIKKWAASSRLAALLKEQDPDCIFICLGMNEMASTKPETQLGASLQKLLNVIGDRDFVWIGPPSWPGKNWGASYNAWMTQKLGADRYFNSSSLQLPRQSSSNPHPTRQGMCQWADALMHWLPQHSKLPFPTLTAPAAGEMSRPPVFIYRKMKQSL